MKITRQKLFLRWGLLGLFVGLMAVFAQGQQTSSADFAPAPLPQVTPDPGSGSGSDGNDDSDSETVHTQGRVNSSSDGTAAVFATDDGGIAIYVPDGQGGYEAAISVTAEELAGLPDRPTRNGLIAATSDRKIRLYKLTTGEYQVNVGPDESGNVRVTIFDGIPPTKVYNRDFNIYDVLED